MDKKINDVVIEDDGNVSDEEYEKFVVPFYRNVEEYVINYIIPEVIAFQFANYHYRGGLNRSKSSLLQHYGGMSDVFNVSISFDEIREEVKRLLKIKYNLIIVNEDPLRFEMRNK